MTLLEARNKASEHSGQSVTVESAFETYRALLKRDYRRPEYVVDRFKRDILPQIGKEQLSRVTRADLADLLQKIVNRGSPVAANRTLTDLKRFFAVCVERGWINTNPAELITRRVTGGKEQSRSRVLQKVELPAVVEVLHTDRFAFSTRLVLGIIMLTGQRSSEVLGLCKPEISGHWWTIPAQRTKPRREQKVYLCPLAMALVRIAFRYLGAKPFTSKHIAISQAVGRLCDTKDEEGNLVFPVRFTPHDLRRTMATRLADVGTMPHVIEKMLNHRLDGIMQVYNRAEYLPERREAWVLWGRTLSKLRREVKREKSNDSVSGPASGVRSSTGRSWSTTRARRDTASQRATAWWGCRSPTSGRPAASTTLVRLASNQNE
jgi:integrase